MKKVLELVLMLIFLGAMLLIFTACGSENDKITLSDGTVLDETLIAAFNSQFEDYSGERVLGTQVDELITNLISNASTNKKEENYLVSVEYDGGEGPASSRTINGNEDAVNDIDTYTENLGLLKNNISRMHVYSVSFEYADFGILNKIIIGY